MNPDILELYYVLLKNKIIKTETRPYERLGDGYQMMYVAIYTDRSIYPKFHLYY